MEAKFTPGSWKHGGTGSEEIYATSDGICVATINHSPLMFDGVATANARLIAAAPDLYDAAENAIEVLFGCVVPAGGVDDAKAILDAKQMLRAALKKAGA